MTIRLAGARLPTFRLEEYFSRWEFVARHHLTASDPETLTISGLLAYADDNERARFLDQPLSYLPTWGTDELRGAIGLTYQGSGAGVEPDDVLAFAGAEEAIFWVLQAELGPGDHAIVTTPNYQSTESIALATGARIDGLPLWTGSGDDLRWTLDLERLIGLLRPETRVVAVNFPANPTGFVPPIEDFLALVGICERRGIRLVSDEVYRGVELDPARRLPAAVEVSPRAVSIGVLSKAYGLPGLRVGWTASRDRALLATLERCKHYTTICNAGPSEALATIALRHDVELRARVRGIVEANVRTFQEFFDAYAESFDWSPPDGGCVTFPRYKGSEGVEAFCARLVEEAGVLLLPASIFASELAAGGADRVPTDRFRLGLGRRDPAPGLAALRAYLDTRGGIA